MTAAVADQVVAAWSRLAADTSALDGATWLSEPGGRDWAAMVLVERHRAGIGGAVVEILQRELSMTVAGLCIRDVIRACNEAYTPIAGRVATATAAGEEFDVAAAVAEAEPFLGYVVWCQPGGKVLMPGGGGYQPAAVPPPVWSLYSP